MVQSLTYPMDPRTTSTGASFTGNSPTSDYFWYKICCFPEILFFPGYFYKIDDDPRQALCGMSIMMPGMLYLVQVIFSLIVWQMIGPSLVGLRWLVSAPGCERQWDAIEIIDRREDPDDEPPTIVSRFEKTSPQAPIIAAHRTRRTITHWWPGINPVLLEILYSLLLPCMIGGLSVGCRILVVVVILAREDFGCRILSRARGSSLAHCGVQFPLPPPSPSFSPKTLSLGAPPPPSSCYCMCFRFI